MEGETQQVLTRRAGPILGMGIATLLFAACFPQGPTAAPSTSSSALATPTLPPSPSPSAPPPSVDAAAWYPVSIFPDDPELGTARMTAVTPTWFGFLAVGWTPRGGKSWWSNDGRSWTAALYDDPSMLNAQPTSVVASDSEIVAVGSIEGPDGAAHPAIWTSDDGLAWSRTLDVPATTSGFVSSVIRTATAFVAVGALDRADGAAIATWTSKDGSTWNVTIISPGSESTIVNGPAGPLVLGQVFRSGDWQAAGWLLDPTGHPTAVTPPFEVLSLTAGPTAYWAFTASPTPGVQARRVYRSTDGVAWTNVGSLPAATSGVSGSIVQSDGSLVVMTTEGDPDSVARVLRSRDGVTWDPVTWPTPLEAGAEISALTAGRDAIVAVGSIGERRAATWLGQPAAADPPEPPERLPPPTGCPPFAVWSSGSGVLDAVLRLSGPQRVRCLSSVPIQLSGYLAQPEGLGGTCEAVATPDWLTGGCPSNPRGWLEGVAVPFGRADTLDLFGRTGIAPLLKTNTWVTITGHFDDPLSASCRLVGSTGELAQPIKVSVEACREHFVVTKVAVGAPPPPPTRDPAAFLGLSSPLRLAPAFEGWDNLPLPDGTAFGFREVTPPAGVGIVVTVFHVLDPATASTVEATLIGDMGPPTSDTVLGVAVARTANGSEAVFIRGSRVIELQIASEATGPTAGQAASLEVVLEALIRALSTS